MSIITYEAAYAFDGGSVGYGNGLTFDVDAALLAGGGSFTVDDGNTTGVQLRDALDGFKGVKRLGSPSPPSTSYSYTDALVRDDDVLVRDDATRSPITLSSESGVTFEKADDSVGLVAPGPHGKLLLSDQFTPTASKATIDVSGIAEFLESGLGHGKIELYYGDPSLAPFVANIGEFNQPLPAGVTRLPVGVVGSRVGPFSLRQEITGLTPGAPVAFEISVQIVGGQMWVPSLPEAVTYAAIQKSFDFYGLFPGTGRKPGDVFVALRGATKVMVLKSNHYLNTGEDTLVGSVTLTSSANAMRLAMLADGSKVLAPNYDTNKLAVVTVPALGLTEVSLPASRTGPSDAAVTPDGATAYVVCYSSGHVCKFDVAAGTFDDSKTLSLGATNSALIVSINPAGTRLYVSMIASRTIKVLDITGSTPTVVATIGPLGTGGDMISRVAVAPDDVKGYVVVGTKIYPITLANNTVGTGVAHGIPSPGPPRVMSDNTALFIPNFAQGANTSQVYQFNLPELSLFQKWPNLFGAVTRSSAPEIVLSPFGAIFVPHNEAFALNVWPGGRFSLRKSYEAFQGEHLTVRASPATA